ncbi:histidine kinase [Massilia sp. Root351]|jgi:signal transduction histidine kinase|uniref:sensor histidine kinase n=1 Tax=Massilia sp. Root351 TaxID=1736522 RepID=UPI00070FDEAA|nr:HAMP domain-containing sensor histidine kinase [Massilia sp. Root351]KQV83678.1 histidine kinase [Massilia sp. Root351]
MTAAHSLRRHIVVAYTLYSFGFVLFFALIAAFAVEGIEEHLVDNRLREVAEWAAPRQAGNLPVEMPAGLSFHRGADIPQSLRGLPPGVQEKTVDGVGLHVLAGHDEMGDYVAVDHESDYEKVELVVYSVFAIGFVGFLLFSYFLGGYVARRLVTPITDMAEAVRADILNLPLQERKDELGVLARAFAAHTAQLRDVLERERFFTGDVSHELRSPLTVIMGAAEVIMAQGEGSAGYAQAARIYRAAQEAAECVTVLLLLARAPQLDEQAQVDIGQVARGETERYQHLVAARPVRLLFDGGAAADGHPGSFAVRAPRELCMSAIGNLVRNACQYTERGTVTVRMGPRSVSVEDTGPGLPAAVRAALAGGERGASQQGVPAAGSAGSAGTGLGLALVRRICGYLGASLVLEDRPGGGSIFVIRFADK